MAHLMPPPPTWLHTDTVPAIAQLEALVLPVLVRLLAHESLRREVPPTLARLMCGRNHLQRAVADSDALQRLSTFLIDQVCVPSLPY